MSEHDDDIHVLPVKYYVWNILFLLFLLLITVYAAFVDFNETAGVVVMLTIAIVKMTAVILVFMHVLWSPRLTQAFAGAAFVWIIIMFTLTFADYVTRNDITTLKEGQLREAVHDDGDHAEDGVGDH